jgi:hypothetical protein
MRSQAVLRRTRVTSAPVPAYVSSVTSAIAAGTPLQRYYISKLLSDGRRSFENTRDGVMVVFFDVACESYLPLSNSGGGW